MNNVERIKQYLDKQYNIQPEPPKEEDKKEELEETEKPKKKKE